MAQRSAFLTAPGAATATGASSPTLAAVLAFFAGCPVLMNLAGTFIDDGNTLAITVGITCLALACAIAAALRIGVPRYDLLTLHGPCLAFAAVGALFWGDWLVINLLSPSPQQQMANQLIQALLWLIIPLTISLCWRRWIDSAQVVRMMVVCSLVFVAGLTLRWALGLGFYQSGRWWAGDSLEAIRSGRYSVIALWVFALAFLAPPQVVSGGFKVLAAVGVPLAVLMVIVTNSRGPALAMAVTLIFTSIPLARLVAGQIGRDARLLVVIIVALALVGAFVASQIGTVESDFGRLFTLTDDGGSAQGRVELWQDHFRLMAQTPLGVLAGLGYDHGLFYPHNAPIEALCDGGVLSFVLLLSMPIIAIRAWLAPRMAGDMIALLFGGLFILTLVGSQVSGGIGTDMSWFGGLLLVLRHEELGRLTSGS